MFRETKRPLQALSKEEVDKVLEGCSTGVLAVNGDNGYPYAVPLNYAYADNKILLHCAVDGHKIDSIKKDDKVSFCVIEKDEVDKEDFKTNFVSVVAFGRAEILVDDIEKKKALDQIAEKYSPEFSKEAEKKIENEWDIVTVVRINIESITGKKGSGLI